jgi:hypothetical protein
LDRRGSTTYRYGLEVVINGKQNSLKTSSVHIIFEFEIEANGRDIIKKKQVGILEPKYRPSAPRKPSSSTSSDSIETTKA